MLEAGAQLVDSSLDTQEHINRVRELIGTLVVELMRRSNDHDQTKLRQPEKHAFDILATLEDRYGEAEFGSYEYYKRLEMLKGALKHHYAHNRHHPEYYEDGISGMSLLDLLEMLLDWKAASERTTNDIFNSLDVNRTRYNIPPDLEKILINTIKQLRL